MNCQKVTDQIVEWLIRKAGEAKAKGFVVGVSGGVDSGLVSTLCAVTNLPVYLIQLPIHRKDGEIPDRANRHCFYLCNKYPESVKMESFDLSNTFDIMKKEIAYPIGGLSELTEANLRSRLRMVTAYAVANEKKCLVVGTGNKVEDYGVGFFTKYGDGGVDISPIGDLMKSEVRELAKYLGVADEIVNAVPTDELWADTRSDETAIGATYDELEWAMETQRQWTRYISFPTHAQLTVNEYIEINFNYDIGRRKQVMKIYLDRHYANAHKMVMPPICEVNKY